MKYQSSEVFNLLNPAFCGELLRRGIKKYEKISKMSMPYSLAFLLLPIVLHKETRDGIDPYSQKDFKIWTIENGHLLIQFSQRAKELIPITQKAIFFLIQNNAIELDGYANLKVKNYTLEGTFKEIKDEVTDCFKKSEVVGKWFAKTGKPKIIYSILGVSP